MLFYDVENGKYGKVKILGLEELENDFGSPLEVFKAALEHEKFVTGKIYELMEIAMEEKEHATISFLKWFIDEQIEEENMMKDIIASLERVQEKAEGLYMIDKELGQRVFSPEENLN